MPSLFGGLRSRSRRNRIYILPSGRGCVFLVIVAIVVLAGATYNNNLIFILGFLLFSLFLLSMLETHFNLQGVTLKFLSSEEGFEDDPIALFLQLQRRAGRKRQLLVRSTAKTWLNLENPRVDLSTSDATQPLRVTVKAWRRGVHPLPVMVVETYFPLGLFRAWMVFQLDGQITVYPRPQGQRTLAPALSTAAAQELGLQVNPEGDFGELRAHRDGESYHHVAWKHFARTGQMYSKVYWGDEFKHYLIPWDPAGADTETYLRQMSSWIQLAVDHAATFEMELPHFKIDCGQGLDQARICWRALAYYTGEP